MNSNATNKTRTGPKRVRTQEPEEEQETPKSPPSSTPSSPTKAAKNALELAVASLPTSLQPLVLHFGHQIITARCKRYAKKSIMQRMEEDKKYIPRSAKATDFKITLSAGAKEDEERVSFLEQQIQQAKDSYESSLKSVIEECIALEIQAVENPNTRLLLISCSQGILSSSSFSCYLLLRLLVYMYLSQLMRTFTNYLKCIVISS